MNSAAERSSEVKIVALKENGEENIWNYERFGRFVQSETEMVSVRLKSQIFQI